MTVSAGSARNLPVAATVEFVDMRAGTPVRAGTFPYEADDVVTGWHSHDLHQIEYALQGVVEVETRAGHYLLPPQQAVWIPAGLAHRTTLRRVRTVSVFFDPRMVDGSGERARILAAAPVIREMIVYGSRWPITRPVSDPVADGFFETLAHLTLEWLDREMPLCLPTSTDPVVAAVMSYTSARLATVTIREVCRAVGLSERTARRRFSAATGMTWRRYLLQTRLLRAMAMLADPGPTVLDIATRVGFDSVSAFTRAFGQYTGQTPTAYRRRVVGGSAVADTEPTGRAGAEYRPAVVTGVGGVGGDGGDGGDTRDGWESEDGRADRGG